MESRIIILKWGKLQCGRISRISVKTGHFWDFATRVAHALSLCLSLYLSHSLLEVEYSWWLLRLFYRGRTRGEKGVDNAAFGIGPHPSFTMLGIISSLDQAKSSLGYYCWPLGALASGENAFNPSIISRLCTLDSNGSVHTQVYPGFKLWSLLVRDRSVCFTATFHINTV